MHEFGLNTHLKLDNRVWLRMPWNKGRPNTICCLFLYFVFSVFLHVIILDPDMPSQFSQVILIWLWHWLETNVILKIRGV